MPKVDRLLSEVDLGKSCLFLLIARTFPLFHNLLLIDAFLCGDEVAELVRFIWADLLLLVTCPPCRFQPLDFKREESFFSFDSSSYVL
jgi:hypothetical protein